MVNSLFAKLGRARKENISLSVEVHESRDAGICHDLEGNSLSSDPPTQLSKPAHLSYIMLCHCYIISSWSIIEKKNDQPWQFPWQSQEVGLIIIIIIIIIIIMINQVTTLLCVTGVPGNPIIINSKNEVDSSFILTWSRPAYDGGDNIIKYKVEWRKKPISNATVINKRDNIGETYLGMSDLDSNGEYEFKVFAKNKAGYSKPDNRTFKVKKTIGMSSLTSYILMHQI